MCQDSADEIAVAAGHLACVLSSSHVAGHVESNLLVAATDTGDDITKRFWNHSPKQVTEPYPEVKIRLPVGLVNAFKEKAFGQPSLIAGIWGKKSIAKQGRWKGYWLLHTLYIPSVDANDVEPPKHLVEEGVALRSMP